jgi:hypothetical protein
VALKVALDVGLLYLLAAAGVIIGPATIGTTIPTSRQHTMSILSEQQKEKWAQDG